MLDDVEVKRPILEEGHKSRLSFHPDMSMMYQDLKETFWWQGMKKDRIHLGAWDEVLPLIEFTYNNSFHASIGMAPYKALYGRNCRTPLCWYQDGEAVLVGP